MTARTGLILPLVMVGRWDDAIRVAESEIGRAAGIILGQLADAARVYIERGELDAAAELVRATDDDGATATGVWGAVVDRTRARLLRAEGRPAEALVTAERAMAEYADSPGDSVHKLAFVEAVEAASELGDLDRAEQLLAEGESLGRGIVTPFLEAQLLRLRARLDALRGQHDGHDERLRTAAGLLEEFGLVFHVAVTRLEHAEWLLSVDRGDEAASLLAQARFTFEELRATPWLERVDAAAASVTSPVS
jgi:ATP/maltotriose-dependent transcriptional regulator MalT